MKRLPLALTMSAAFWLTACATAPQKPAVAAPEPQPSALAKAIPQGEILLAAQPTLEDLQGLKSRDIRHVFNLRTPEEMSTLSFDEPALIAQQGIGYEQHPVNGNAAWTPQLLAAFAKAVQANDGKVLLHCASGGRAATLYAAYAMKYLGKTPDEAVQIMVAAGSWPLPLERLTGERLSLVRSKDPEK